MQPPTMGIITDFLQPDRIEGALAYARSQGLNITPYHAVPPGGFPPDPDDDGFLFMVGERPDLYARVRAMGRPVVTTDCMDDCPWVASDDLACGAAAAAEFAGIGLRVVSASPGCATPAERRALQGFRDEAHRRGLHFHSLPPWPDHPAAASPARRMAHAIAALPRPCGVFLHRATSAISLTKALSAAALRIPDDVALIVTGTEPEGLCEFAPVPLSAVTPDHWRIGFESARLLHGILSGHRPAEPTRRVPPVGIHRRLSSEARHCGDPFVGQALRLIAAPHGATLRIKELMESLSLGRRALEQRFRRATGTTLHRALTDRRMDAARELLANPAASLESIARRCGFSSLAYFTTAFHRAVGVTPMAWRQKHAAAHHQAAASIINNPASAAAMPAPPSIQRGLTTPPDFAPLQFHTTETPSTISNSIAPKPAR